MNENSALGQARITAYFDENRSILSVTVHEAK